MFTGLIQALGRVVDVHKVGPEMDIRVELDLPSGPSRVGDSVALSGVCCTVTELAAPPSPGRGATASFRLSAETLERTWFPDLAAGDRLNVEAAVRAGDPLGGHVVQGHVDGVGRVTGPIDPSGGGELRVELPRELARHCVEKGAIAIDGVSLTIASIDGTRVRIAVIPHTAQVTTLGTAAAGRPVNVEVDVFAKYVERYVESYVESYVERYVEERVESRVASQIARMLAEQRQKP